MSSPATDLQVYAGDLQASMDTTTTVAIFSLIVGCVLLVEGVFTFMVAEDRTIMKAVRLVLVHHAFLTILLAVNDIIYSVFVLRDETRPNCLVIWITREVAENLVQWSLVLLALFALALNQMQGPWDLFLSNTRLHAGLVTAVWAVCAVVEIVLFALPGAFADFQCRVLTCPSFRAKTTALVFSHVVLIVLVVMGYLSARRCARLVSSEQEDFLRRIRLSRQVHLAGTLAMICRLAAVVNLMTSSLYLYFAFTPSCKRPPNAFMRVLFSLWYLGQVCVFPILLARHQILRQRLKEAICRKCLLLQRDTFTHTVECRYSTVEVCREFMSTSKGQLSLKTSRESAKARSEVDAYVKSKLKNAD